jgi:hypothetical protein
LLGELSKGVTYFLVDGAQSFLGAVGSASPTLLRSNNHPHLNGPSRYYLDLKHTFDLQQDDPSEKGSV